MTEHRSSYPFEIFTPQELRAIPEPEWLVHDLLESDGLAILYGPPGCGKTFAALDLVGHVVSGTPWHGRPVMQGKVLYVAAEGGGMFARRIDALQQELGLSLDSGLFVATEAFSLHNATHVDGLIAGLKGEHPDVRLVIVDTLARCYSGEENSGEAMGLAVQATDRIRKEANVGVLLIHHSVKAKSGGYRGHSALAGAAETIIAVKRTKGGHLELVNEKQKNAEEFKPMAFELKTVTLPNGATSKVLAASNVTSGSGALQNNADAVLGVLTESYVADGQPLKLIDWRIRSASKLKILIPEGTFRHWKDDLLKRGLIESVEAGRWRPTAQTLPSTVGTFTEIRSTATIPPFQGDGVAVSEKA